MNILSFFGERFGDIWEECPPLRQARPETGEYPINFKNHSQLPNIFIRLSFFGLFFHVFKVNKVSI